MKTQNAVVEVEKVMEDGESSPQIIYPSASTKRKIKLALLRWDYDLSPYIIEKYTNKKGEAVEKHVWNPDFSVKITHSLKKPVKGHNKAESIKKIYRYIAKSDLKDPSGNIYVHKGQEAFSYDKYKFVDGGREEIICILEQAMKKWAKVGNKQYRRSIELLIPAYVYEYEDTIVDEKTKKKSKEITEINDVRYVSFSMIDLFWPDKGGFAEQLIDLYDDGNKLKSSVLQYTDKTITATRELDLSNKKSEDYKLIAPLRDPDNLAKWEEEHAKLQPLSYDELMEEYEKDPSVIALPSDKIVGHIETNVKEEIPEEFDISNLGDDEIPF